MSEPVPKKSRILVADDDSSILDLFQQVLSRVETDRTVHLKTGESESKLFQENASSQSLQLFDVVTCQQGDEAVDAVKSSIKEDWSFSVAFIDIRMPPGPDGIWTAEQIRRLDANVEILIMTGYSDAHPRDITRRVPPVHKLLYFQKPFHIQEIYQFASALSMKWHTEKELAQRKFALEKLTRELIETNQALSVLARNIDKDKEALEQRIYKITSSKIMPIVKGLQEDESCSKRQADLEVLATHLNNIATSSSLYSEIDTSLTNQEMRVAVMVKNGLTGPKIANLLHISLDTVKTHRKNIRKKLKIQNSKVNLASFLKSKFRQ